MDLLNTCLALCCHLVIMFFVIVVLDNDNDVDDDARVFVYLICGFPQASLPRSPPLCCGKAHLAASPLDPKKRGRQFS